MLTTAVPLASVTHGHFFVYLKGILFHPIPPDLSIFTAGQHSTILNTATHESSGRSGVLTYHYWNVSWVMFSFIQSISSYRGLRYFPSPFNTRWDAYIASGSRSSPRPLLEGYLF